MAKLEIYPNPSRDIFNVEFTTATLEDVEIVVVNSIGQEIYVESSEIDGEYSNQIDLSNHSKGIYNLVITTADETTNYRLVLQ